MSCTDCEQRIDGILNRDKVGVTDEDEKFVVFFSNLFMRISHIITGASNGTHRQ